jgi:Na+-driven multidrug efflux pump
MACFGQYWSEFQELSDLARPSMITNSLEALLVVEDVIMLGHLGRSHIAALAVGNALFNFAWYFIEGFFTAQDTLSSIAFAQHDLRALRYWTYSSLFCALFLCAVATTIYVFANTILEQVFLISPHVASKATLHVYVLSPSVWFFALFRVLQKFLASQNITKPTVHALMLGNVVNIILNYVLIFLCGLGFIGCAISTSVSRLCMLLFLYKRVKSSIGFVHMRLELKALVRRTPAEAVMKQVEVVEEALYGSPARRTRGRVRRKLASILEHIGTQLHIKSLARWAKRWGQQPDADEVDLEMSTLLDNSGRAARKPKLSSRRSPSVLPYAGEPEGTAKAGISPLPVLEENVENREPSCFHIESDTRAGSGEEAGPTQNPLVSGSHPSHSDSYLDDVHLDETAYTRKYKIYASDKHASTALAALAQHAEQEHLHDDSEGGDDDDAGNASNEDAEDEDNDDEEETVETQQRGPRMLMFIRTLRFLAIGIPGGIACGLEAWVFCVIIMFIQRIGTVPLAAAFIGMVLIETVYAVVPFSLSVACTLRVSQLLVTKRPELANVCSATSMILGSSFVGLTATLTYFLPSLVANIFTLDEDVIERVRQLAPFIAGYQAMWGLVGLAQGVLRAQGKQMEIVAFIFCSMWLLGVPLAWYWGFYVRPTMGLAGFWLGLIVGMGLLTFILLVMVLAADWHYESRAMVVRAEREREGFTAPASSNMWMSKGLGTISAGATHSPLCEEIAIQSLPQVGLPSVGSRATGGFSLGPDTLDETLDIMEQIQLELTDAPPTAA